MRKIPKQNKGGWILFDRREIINWVSKEITYFEPKVKKHVSFNSYQSQYNYLLVWFVNMITEYNWPDFYVMW